MAEGDGAGKDEVLKPRQDRFEPIRPEFETLPRRSVDRDVLGGDRDLLDRSWQDKGWANKGWSNKGWSNKGWSDNGWAGSPDSGETGRTLADEAWFGSLRESLKPWSPSAEQSQLLRQLGASAPVDPMADKALLKPPGELSPWQVPGEIEKLFAKLDRNQDGAIDFDELGRAVKDRSYTGSAAQALAALYQARDHLAGPPKEGDTSPAKISPAGLSKLSELKQLAELEPAMVTIARTAKMLSNTSIFPRDENGLLQKDTLEAGGRSVPAKDIKLLEFARAHFDEIKKLGDSLAPAAGTPSTTGLDDKGLARLSSLPRTFTGLKVMHELSQVLDSAAYVQQYDSTTLFNGSYGFMGLLHRNAIVPDAVQEGIIHDCKLDAPLAALANFDDKAIEKMVVPDAKGEKFTVTFPSVPGEPITVDGPSQAELALFNQSGPRGIWANVIEKAYGEYVRRHPERFGKPCSESDPAAQCLEDGGLWEETTMLTGHAVQPYSLDKIDAQNIKTALVEGLAEKSVLTLASINRPSDKRVSNSHLYAILGFDPNGPEGGTLSLYDPYGNRSPSGDGHFTVSFNQLFNDFQWMAVERQGERKHRT
jgi:hypothetical protein